MYIIKRRTTRVLSCLLLFLFAGIAFLSFYRYRKADQELQALKERDQSFEETLNRLVHNAKNPLATTAMALHNLSFVLKEDELSAEKQDASVNEFLNAALLGIDETNERLKETLLFSKTEWSHLEPVHLSEIADSVIEEIAPAVTILTVFDSDLPMVYSDIQAMRLVFSYLLNLVYSNSQKQIIHFKINKSDTNPKNISCEIFNHRYLGKEMECTNALPKASADLDDPGTLQLKIVQRILSFHHSELKGCFEKQNGGYWIFTLLGIKE